MSEERILKENKIYRHYKGNDYQILHIAFNATNDRDMEKLVVYKSLKDGQVWVRNYDEFNSVMEDGSYRFVELSDGEV